MLSTRARNLIRRSRLSLYQLKQLPESELKRIPGMGVTTIKEIKNAPDIHPLRIK